VLTGSLDKTAQIWDAVTGRPGPCLPHGHYVLGAVFSPDGRTVLTGSWDTTAQLWNADTGERGPCLRHPNPVGIGSMRVSVVAFSPDGKTIVTGTSETVAFSSDGKTILTAKKTAYAQLWDPTTGQPIGQRLFHGSTICAAAFNSAGDRLVTGSEDRTARI